MSQSGGASSGLNGSLETALNPFKEYKWGNSVSNASSLLPPSSVANNKDETVAFEYVDSISLKTLTMSPSGLIANPDDMSSDKKTFIF